MIPEMGEIKLKFNGFFRVARENPTTNDWATAEVYVNILDIFFSGKIPGIGEVKVTINPNVVSAGQVLPPGTREGRAKCRIGAAALFDVPGMSTLFNKEPILLMNDGIKSVPPVEDPNGVAHLYYLPLFDRGTPDGRPVAYLTSLKYTVGNYVTQAQARRIRDRVQGGSSSPKGRADFRIRP